MMMDMPIKGKTKFTAWAYRAWTPHFKEPLGPAKVPGPLLEVSVGETLVVHFRNKLKSPVTMPVTVTHWPASGVLPPLPWTSWISWVSQVGGGGSQAAPQARGSGVPVVKSAALLSVSVAPFPSRRSEVVLLGEAAGAVSEKLAVP